jgi:hypothetical protein
MFRRHGSQLVLERTADQEARETAAMLVTQAQMQISAVLSNSDSHDNKAVGLLAASAASVGLLVSAHTSLDRYWWVTCVGLLVAIAFFMATLFNRGFPVGPDVTPFYAANWDKPSLYASVQLLSELATALRECRRTTARKGRLLTGGYISIVATAAASALYLPLVH